MTKLNRNLAVVAAALLVLAAFTYRHSVSRADRFESGQKLLQNLDPDAIAGIVVEAGEETVELSREGERFVVVQRDGYRARNQEVNRVIRDLLAITLERRMGRGDELAAELGLVDGDDTATVRFRNDAGEDMVALRLGDTAEDGGRYVQRLDGEDRVVYRTEEGVSVATDVSTFLDREIVDHSASSVVRIDGPDFVLARQPAEGGGWEGDLELEGGEAETSEVNRLASFLSRLSFDEVFVADDPAVTGLSFDQTFSWSLDDRSGYRIEVAEAGEGEDAGTYVRIRGFFDVDRLEVGQEETDEELEEKAGVLRRSDEIGRFNQYHGSWVYLLGDSDADDLDLRRADLLGDG